MSHSEQLRQLMQGRKDRLKSLANNVLHGDCVERLRECPDNMFTACVTDPPYELGFMGKSWDGSGVAFDPKTWKEILRVTKPGGMLLAFGGTRTHHRLICAIEDAGWEIRDCLMWMYFTGFPKSHDIGKAIDKVDTTRTPEREAVGSWLRGQRERAGLKQKEVAKHWPSNTGGLTGCVANWELGFNCPTWVQWQTLKSVIGFANDMDAEVWRLNGRKGKPGKAWDDREVVGHSTDQVGVGWVEQSQAGYKPEFDITAPATDLAQTWDGYGTALKPAYESICLAMKPLDGTFANNAQTHGVAGLNIDGSRIESGGEHCRGTIKSRNVDLPGAQRSEKAAGMFAKGSAFTATDHPAGRWPANLLHDGSEEVLEGFPETGGGGSYTKSGGRNLSGPSRSFGSFNQQIKNAPDNYGDSAARFFKCCEFEQCCFLCGLPLGESRDTMSETSVSSKENVSCKSRPARSAEKCSKLTSQTNGSTVQRSATLRDARQLAQRVKSAGNLCGSCATATAQSIVAMQQGQSLGSLLGKASISEPNEQILLRNLALLVASLDSTGTTPTIESLKLLFGSVRHAIASSIAESTTESCQRRFRYSAKASKAERNAGLEGMVERLGGSNNKGGTQDVAKGLDRNRPVANHHPTVKPLALMKYLVGLVTMPKHTYILDPFCGSGSTLKACQELGVDWCGIDSNLEYVEIARKRVLG